MNNPFINDQYQAATSHANWAMRETARHLHAATGKYDYADALNTRLEYEWLRPLILRTQANAQRCPHVDLTAPSVWCVVPNDEPILQCLPCGITTNAARIAGDEKWRCDRCDQIKVNDCKDTVLQAGNVMVPCGFCQECADYLDRKVGA